MILVLPRHKLCSLGLVLLIVSPRGLERETSFGLKEFQRNSVGYDFYSYFPFGLLWFIRMDSYSYVGLAPIPHISKENRHYPRLNGKNPILWTKLEEDLTPLSPLFHPHQTERALSGCIVNLFKSEDFGLLSQMLNYTVIFLISDVCNILISIFSHLPIISAVN